VQSPLRRRTDKNTVKGKEYEPRSEGKERLETILIVKHVTPDTFRRDELEIEEKIVVFFDVCSSSKIIDNLKLSDRLKDYRDLLIVLKDFLLKQRERGVCEVYKFIGDGWVLLLPPSIEGERFTNLLYNIAELFHTEMEQLRRKLSTTPKLLGLTYGVDRGKIIRLSMDFQVEYIGRPLNVAARLQGAVKDRENEKDKNPAYKALISMPAFEDLKIPRKYRILRTSRKLRNIQDGEDYKCVELTVFNPTTSTGISG
jgi:class 3 adenylate cyclase